MRSTTLSMAWRNLWRNRRRTLLTLGAIAFSCAVLVFFVALQLSSYVTSIDATLGVLQGHIQVQAPGYLATPEMRETVVKPIELKNRLSQNPDIKASAVRAQGFALLSSESRSIGAFIVGVEPEHETRVSNIPANIRVGRFLLASDQQHIVLGKHLAKSLQVQPGSEVTLLGQSWDGSVAASVVTVVGIFESGSPDVDRAFVEMPLHAFQETFAMGDRAHALVFTVNSLEAVETVQAQMTSQLQDSSLLALSWTQLIPGLKAAIELDFVAGWLFYCSLVIVVGFTVLNTFLMTVLERTREFGVMMALGTSHLRIARLIVTECALITLLGLILGIMLGGSVVIYFGITGFSLPGSAELAQHWHIPASVFTRLSPLSLTLGPGLLLLAALLAVVYPTWRVTRLTIVEALRAV